MDATFQRALSLVLEDEGGFVNDPQDLPGAAAIHRRARARWRLRAMSALGL